MLRKEFGLFSTYEDSDNDDTVQFLAQKCDLEERHMNSLLTHLADLFDFTVTYSPIGGVGCELGLQLTQTDTPSQKIA